MSPKPPGRSPRPATLHNLTAGVAVFGKCAMQYSSPSRATRKSRFGSLSSVAPQTAQLWSVSARLANSAQNVCVVPRHRARCRA